MMNYGFVKVATAVPSVRVADCKYNAQQIEKLANIAEGKGVRIIVFPELSITGYTCGDLFQQQLLLDDAEMQLMQLLNNTRQLDIITIVGMPVLLGAELIKAAIVMKHGTLLGVVPKTYLPNYKQFYEKRWFTSAIDVDKQNIRLCGQIVPLDSHLLFD